MALYKNVWYVLSLAHLLNITLRLLFWINLLPYSTEKNIQRAAKATQSETGKQTRRKYAEWGQTNIKTSNIFSMCLSFVSVC